MSPNQLLIKYTLRYPLLTIATTLLGVSGALFNGVSIALIVPLLLGFLGQESINFKGGPPVLHKILAFFDGFPPDTRLFALTGTVLLAIILKNATTYLNDLSSTYLSIVLTRSMRLDGIRVLLDVDIDFYDKHKMGDIMNRLNDEVNRTSMAIRAITQLATQAATILVFIAILLSISWQLTLISNGLIFVVALANQYFIKRAKDFGKVLSEKAKQQTNKTLEILMGIRLIKTVSTEDQEYRKIYSLIKEREKASFQSQANYAIIGPINEVSGLVTILVIVILGRSFFAQELEAVSTVLLTYLIVLFRLLPVIGQLNSTRSRFANNSASLEIVTDFLNRENKPIMTNGQQNYDRLEKGIRFENLTFAYPAHEDLVLRNINLWIPKGQTTAFVGSSGAGKSTLVDLVPRYYDGRQGRILLDGIDLRDYNLSTLRRRMGIVSQDTFLFNDSVRYNIAYGKDDVTEEEIITAAKRANAYQFIIELPEGFETKVGDRGVMLSGGQRQRLAIARALLRDPDILILDEATSALDTVSERLVQEAIEELCRDRTTLVIAHRLSTIQKANQIVVMDQGMIVEIGTHDQLLEKDGFYARLYAMQFGKPKRPKVLLPTNEALIRASIRASQEIRTRLSYEVRTRLNAMLGLLKLVTDDLVDTPEEQKELIEESYSSALQLLKVISYFEEKGSKLPIE